MTTYKNYEVVSKDLDEKDKKNRDAAELRFQNACEKVGDVQCPVVVVPNDYKPFDKIVLLYDSSPTGIYAVKMFTYLF